MNFLGMPFVNFSAKSLVRSSCSIIHSEIDQVLHIRNVCPDRIKVVASRCVVIYNIIKILSGVVLPGTLMESESPKWGEGWSSNDTNVLSHNIISTTSHKEEHIKNTSNSSKIDS